MNVLHINSYYILAPFYKNLYDRQIQNLNIDVYVPISIKYQDVNKDIGQYSKKSIAFKESDRLFFFKKHRKIYEDINQQYTIEQYDLIHAHSLFSNGYIAYKLKKKYEIPYIVAIRNTDVNLFFKKMLHLRPVGLKIMNEASKVVFISEAYRSHVLKKYIPLRCRKKIYDKSVIIPNGIDQFWIDNKNYSRIVRNPDEKIRIICVGDIEKNKNQKRTAMACEILLRDKRDVIFNIVGRNNDKEMCERLQNMTFVNYYGTMRKENLLNIYRENDIFVMPSLTETFGIAYAEAMSQGLPIIYTKGQGFDGQFDEGIVGYHVNPNDEYDIAQKIEKIFKHREVLSQRCIEKVDKFNWDNITDMYMKIYSQINGGEK